MEQAFVYKDGKAELHDKDTADRMKADEGWFDNPAEKLSEIDELRKENAALKADGDDTDDEQSNEWPNREVTGTIILDSGKDASGVVFDPDIHFGNKHKDDEGNWKVKKAGT